MATSKSATKRTKKTAKTAGSAKASKSAKAKAAKASRSKTTAKRAPAAKKSAAKKKAAPAKKATGAKTTGAKVTKPAAAKSAKAATKKASAKGAAAAKSSSKSRGSKKTLASVAIPQKQIAKVEDSIAAEEEAVVYAVDPPTLRLDEPSARQTLIELLALRGGSGDESAVADRIVERLTAAGLPEDAAMDDGAHERIGYGRRGNLIIKLPGRGRLQRTPRRMFSAHMDTVPLCVGAQPVLNGDWIRGRDEDKALGGDDRSGCAVLMTIARALLDPANAEIDHPPITLLFTVQEELGLRGARHVDTSALGRPQLCFNFDGGSPHSMVIGATGDMRVDIGISGIASHAGVNPQAGVSSAIILSKALAHLQEEGWHGAVSKDEGRPTGTGTSNAGVITGGSATNVVMEDLQMQAEIRSHSEPFRRRIADAWKQAFEQAAKTTRNEHGDSGSIDWHEELKYESFALESTEPVVTTALAAMEIVGLEPATRVVDGGLDANWLAAHGLPSVTIGCGQHGIHTTSERLHVPEFFTACRIGLALATAAA